MQRVFHSKEDQKLAHRWLLINVAAYSTAALMIVLFSALPAPRNAGLVALRGPAPGFSKSGLHSRRQADTIVATRPAPTVVARR